MKREDVKAVEAAVVADVKAAEAKVFPQLTNDHKLAVREAQYMLTNTKTQCENALKNAENYLMQTIERIAAELKIEAKDAMFDLHTLLFGAKK